MTTLLLVTAATLAGLTWLLAEGLLGRAVKARRERGRR